MPSPSRLSVAKALRAVFDRGSRIPEHWDAGLTAENAAFAQALLGQCLRRWGRLQAWATPRLKTPGRSLPLGTQVALAMGLAQLAWLEGVADHAAVNEAVELVSDPELGFPPHRGLVNALLRQASKDRVSLRQDLDGLDPALDRTPFAERILDAAVGVEAASREALWTRLQHIPTPGFLCLRGQAPPELEPDPDLAEGLRRREGQPFPVGWLQSGAGMVQDRSSQALMEFSWEAKPRLILDACAAPGGKTTALGRRFPEARLVAVERSPRRARRLEGNLQLREVPAEIVVADAAEWLRQTALRFDLIVLDAPCSGSGTLAKHPELTWIGAEIDLDRLRGQQEELLEAAVPALSPGGLLIYAVCSWFPAEGLDHRTKILEAHKELEPADLWPSTFGPPGVFRPDPLRWEGEGFQGFAFQRSSGQLSS